METKMSAKKQIIRGFLALTLFVFVIPACSNSTSKTPTPITPTKSPEITSYQFVLEKSLGRGIVEAADWAPDGSSFALATSVQVDLYDARTFEIVATLDTKQWTKLIAYSPDSRWLAAGSEDGAIQIWDIVSRRLVHKLIPSEKHLFHWRDPDLAFSRDNQKLVSAYDQTLYLWDVNTGELLDSFPGHMDGIYEVAISPDGKIVIAAGFSTLHVRDVSSRVLLYPPIPLPGNIEAILFDQEPERFKTVNSDWKMNHTTGTTDDTTLSQMYKSMPLDEDILLTSLVFSPSGNLIVAGTVDGKILLIDFAELEILATLTGQHGAVERLIFSPEGQFLFSGSADGTVRTWGLP